MNDILDQLNDEDDLSPLDGALESGEVFEIAAELGAELDGEDLLAGIDESIDLNAD